MSGQIGKPNRWNKSARRDINEEATLTEADVPEKKRSWAAPIILAAIAVLASGHRAESASAEGSVKAPFPASALRGENIYLKSCAACHGDDGAGKGPAAGYMNPLPRDFTSGMYKFRATASGELPTDADLLRVVDEGVSGTLMPAWKGVLTPQERLDVVAYIKQFSEDFQTPAPEPVAIPEAPPDLAKYAPEGKMIYMLMECWACHGGKGKGNGQSGKTLKDDWGAKIRPWDLTGSRYKAGHDAQSLFRTITTGLNGTPMPAYALDGFLIGGGVDVEPAKYQEAYKAPEIEALRDWLQIQPTEARIQGMPEEKRNAIAEHRKWALVAYIQSLVRHPGFFSRMFTENIELTP